MMHLGPVGAMPRSLPFSTAGERADAGVGEREGAGCCAQLGQPPLLRLSPRHLVKELLSEKGNLMAEFSVDFLKGKTKVGHLR